jgi:hypothetical protein
MAEQIINIGTTANDGTGDTLRESQRKSKRILQSCTLYQVVLLI